MHLIDRWEAEGIREAALDGSDYWDELPYIETDVATGRATCRECGKKIKKGDRVVRFPYSFTDGSYNSFTAYDCYIHLDDCKEKKMILFHGTRADVESIRERGLLAGGLDRTVKDPATGNYVVNKERTLERVLARFTLPSAIHFRTLAHVSLADLPIRGSSSATRTATTWALVPFRIFAALFRAKETFRGRHSSLPLIFPHIH